ncbi:MAG: hypothetical protein DIU63_04465 [Proteobacteria bacterium]|nr:MAG: hypothetical protein DIU63_04465 [Pseudomonadota bacterium]
MVLSTHAIAGRVLCPGSGQGPLLKLSAPLSFWGGVDPATGRIILDHHPERGLSIAGTVLAFEKPIGSSSSSSVLLELIHNGAAPAAILLGDLDAILIVGCLVAKELGLSAPPVLYIEEAHFSKLTGKWASVDNGAITIGCSLAPITSI